ncbi:hypothetical protein GTA08_BOTSDO11331 [Neofusicoccum parvum]|uniref:Uncharacterized protein n=1 Tax=Neofusicoccum parvum TaxID=310453 RepID=A0ACB5RZ46_9PEZI|nr:hypothetical protein GTA08_BOTSDO11331 [Neofusicoccum parvum]
MKLAILATLLAAASTAVASPTTPNEPRQATSPDGFKLNIRWSNGPLRGAVSANGGSFWINKATKSYCPGRDVIHAACPAGTDTSFVGGGPDGRLSLNTVVPGGQQVYVGPRGLLRYTPAHSGDMPKGSITSGLVVQETSGFLNPFYQLWMCNTDADAGVWQIWVEQRDAEGTVKNWGKTEKNACTRVNLEMERVDGVGAWQYD